MQYGEYYLILPSEWDMGVEPVQKRMGADTTWQDLMLYPSSEEEVVGAEASGERTWLSRRIDQINVLAHDNAGADNIIKYNNDSGSLSPWLGTTQWWNPEFANSTGYYRRAWSTRCKDAPGYADDGTRPVSSAADSIRIARQLLGIESAYGRFNFPWMESYDTGEETRDPCGALPLLALMEAAGRLVGWSSSHGYFSDQRGFGGGTLTGGIVRIPPICSFETEYRDSWVFHDVTTVARHFISTEDPGAYDKMFLLTWKEFVMPPRNQWPGGFMKFDLDKSQEVTLWPES